jgi:hypothetical protein
MVKTHTWEVSILAPTTIADLNPVPQSIYEPGSYVAGQQDVNIASVSIKNVGTVAGTLQYRCYIYANEAGETLLLDGTTTNTYAPGQSVQQPLVVDIPSNATPGSITFGVKVKGQTETTWPAWGALGTLMWDGNYAFSDAMDVAIGILMAAGVIGVLMWAGKKR